MRSGVKGRLKIQAAFYTTKPEVPEVLVMSIDTTAEPSLHAGPVTRHSGEGTVPRHSRTRILVKMDKISAFSNIQNHRMSELEGDLGIIRVYTLFITTE